VDSYEWNKIFGWVLAAGIAVLGLSIVTGYVYPSGHSEEKGYVVEGVEVEAEAGAAGAAEAQPIAMFLADANVAKGEAQFKKCAACHTVAKGGPNNQGPNLWGIVGAKVAHLPNFAYSDAVKGHGGSWDWDAMGAWLESPRKYIPGNKMSFAGIANPKDRADLIAYLNTQSDSPLPIPPKPAAQASATADAAAAAPGDTATAGDASAPAPAAETASAQ
jgi:cytochrome c